MLLYKKINNTLLRNHTQNTQQCFIKKNINKIAQQITFESPAQCLHYIKYKYKKKHASIKLSTAVLKSKYLIYNLPLIHE